MLNHHLLLVHIPMFGIATYFPPWQLGRCRIRVQCLHELLLDQLTKAGLIVATIFPMSKAFQTSCQNDWNIERWYRWLRWFSLQHRLDHYIQSLHGIPYTTWSIDPSEQCESMYLQLFFMADNALQTIPSPQHQSFPGVGMAPRSTAIDVSR